MIIKSIETKEKTYDCYDFTFVKGVVLPVTLDLEAGDTIDVGPDRIVASILERPSLSDPKKLLPGEDFSIERSNLLFYQHRTITVQEQTHEQKQEFRDTILQVPNSVN